MLVPSELLIRPATVEDVGLILEFIREFADHVRMADRVIATPEALAETLFGPKPYAEALVAEWSNEPVGYAIFYHTYSSFRALPGIYLEDLFVRRTIRQRGIGRALLARVARIARERGCGRVEWSTLDWNEAAIGFYLHLGAQRHQGSGIFGLLDDALARLAAEGEAGL